MERMTKELWLDFVAPQVKDPPAGIVKELPLAPEIKDSWLRCKTQQLDPYNVEERFLTGQELAKEQARNTELIGYFKHEIRRLKRYHGMMEPLFVLTDMKGVILYRDGYQGMKESADQIDFREGNRWDEDSAGTNAIALAIRNRKPSRVTGLEHYNLASHKWNCWATPIFDRNEAVAVIDLSSQRLQGKDLRQMLLLIEMIGETISLKLTQHSLDRQQQLYEYMLDHPQQIAVLDPSSQIIRLAPQGQALGLGEGWRISEDGLTIDGRIYTKEAILSKGTLLGYSLKEKKVVDFVYSGVETRNHEMQQLLTDAKRLAASQLPVHIVGETGVGKELLAKAIHENSSNAQGPLVAINCGAMSEQLLESELFGYAEGAFTDAKKGGHQGKIQQANGGTLFLDEIDSMTPRMQQMLLRVLENKEIIPVGGTKAIPVDFRLVSASNKNLKELARSGKFRKDLYYRIYVGVLSLPALRERKEDLLSLMAEFAQEKDWRVDWLPELVPVFENYAWEGNIRELRNVLERIMAFYPYERPAVTEVERLIAIGSLGEKLTEAEAGETEKLQLIQALQQNQFHITRTAEMLGISRSTLYRKLKAYKIHCK